MLSFDPARSSFVLGSCRFGIAAALDAVLACLPGAVCEEVPEKNWTFLSAKDGDLNISLHFDAGRLDSGYFWVLLPDESTSWDDYEADERRRRAAHLKLLQRLFGAGGFRDSQMVVEPMRDPKNGLEIIAFNRPPEVAAGR